MNEVSQKTTFQLERVYEALNNQLYWQMTHHLDKTKRHYLENTRSWIGLIGDELDARKRCMDGGANDGQRG